LNHKVLKLGLVDKRQIKGACDTIRIRIIIIDINYIPYAIISIVAVVNKNCTSINSWIIGNSVAIDDRTLNIRSTISGCRKYLAVLFFNKLLIVLQLRLQII
jgi:hypothetical protein